MTTFNKEFDIVYLNCYDATTELDYTITYENLTEGIIRFKTKPSIRSYGEKFEIKLAQVDEKHTSVEFSSEPRFGIQLISWGRNNANEDAFISLLTEMLKK